MGTQKTGSYGGDGGQEANSHALSRQGFPYNLIFDEIQHQLGDSGKEMTSMNIDELLKSVWTTEDNQEMDRSRNTLSQDLIVKTESVDELWQDIKQGNKKNDIDRKALKRQPSLGEMTLEDFLVKAGLVAESLRGKKNTGPELGAGPLALSQTNFPSQQPVFMQTVEPQQQLQHQQNMQTVEPQQQLQHQQNMQTVEPQQQLQHQQNMPTVFLSAHHSVREPLPIGANPVMDAAAYYPETQMTMLPFPWMATFSDTQETTGRKRGENSDVVEKTFGRRIENVESFGGNELMKVKRNNLPLTSLELISSRGETSEEREYRTTDISLSHEDLVKHFGKKLDDAAHNLRVSRSTMKRACRVYGIKKWPCPKRKKVKSAPSILKNLNHAIKRVRDGPKQIPKLGNSRLSCSNPPPMNTTGAVAHTIPNVLPKQDEGSMTVKATYGVEMIRFQLSFSSKKADLMEKVTLRLPLKDGTFNVKYEDDDGDWVLIACDEDLEECIGISKGKSTIKMFVQPLANEAP